MLAPSKTAPTADQPSPSTAVNIAVGWLIVEPKVSLAAATACRTDTLVSRQTVRKDDWPIQRQAASACMIFKSRSAVISLARRRPNLRTDFVGKRTRPTVPKSKLDKNEKGSFESCAHVRLPNRLNASKLTESKRLVTKQSGKQPDRKPSRRPAKLPMTWRGRGRVKQPVERQFERKLGVELKRRRQESCADANSKRSEIDKLDSLLRRETGFGGKNRSQNARESAKDDSGRIYFGS
jgi:hypothetical protein